MASSGESASGFRAVFGLDLRSLAVLRVCLGVVLLADLLFRSADFASMYASSGFAPVDFVRGLQTFYQWSLYFLDGDSWFQAALFIAEAVFALALLVGWHTRLATIACWALVISLHVRLPVVLSGADQLLRALLFWGMFLPLGAAWSLDARRRERPASMRVVSVATAAFLLQIALVYWTTGWAKYNDDWLASNALGNILSTGLFSLPLGRWMAQHDWLTLAMSRGTVWFELLGPVLLFIPLQTAWLRVIAVAAFLAFHVGIAATMVVGLFSFVAMGAWLALVPTEAWDWLLQRKRAKESEHVETAAAPVPEERHRLFTLCWGLKNAVCAAALSIMLYCNWCSVGRYVLADPVHGWIYKVAQLGYLYQSWGMFGIVGPSDCWFVYQATLRDGRKLDLLSHELGTEHDEPMLAWQRFPNDRWRKLHWNMLSDFGAPYRQPLAEYIVRRWNERHPANEQIVRFDLYSHSQPFKSRGAEDRYVQMILAEVVVDEEGGNFSEALEQLEDGY